MNWAIDIEDQGLSRGPLPRPPRSAAAPRGSNAPLPATLDKRTCPRCTQMIHNHIEGRLLAISGRTSRTELGSDQTTKPSCIRDGRRVEQADASDQVMPGPPCSSARTTQRAGSAHASSVNCSRSGSYCSETYQTVFSFVSLLYPACGG
jgi:hypothetical protein